MDCQELVELVTDYLDGVLPPEQENALRVHVQDCVDCLRYLGQLQLTSRLLGRLGRGDLSARL